MDKPYKVHNDENASYLIHRMNILHSFVMCLVIICVSIICALITSNAWALLASLITIPMFNGVLKKITNEEKLVAGSRADGTFNETVNQLNDFMETCAEK